MRALSSRFEFLFRSTKGLALVAFALVSLETVLFGMLSGPMADLGIRDVWVRLTGMQLVAAEREGRIILLYHTIAQAVIAVEVYFITSLWRLKPHEQATINGTITLGYITSMVFGMWFAYFGHDFLFHGLFIFGQCVVFVSGLMLAWALWPFRAEYRVQDRDHASWRGWDVERLAVFVMAISTLISACFGAVPAAYWGRGQEAFLAEDLIRLPEKTGLELAVIGHLHIMLTLIAVALTLILGRWFDFKGRLHKWAMPLLIVGTLIVDIGVWSIVVYERTAHVIINVGSGPVLGASMLLTVFGWRRLIRERLPAATTAHPTVWSRLGALFNDPLRFGALWQMVYMNFVVTFIGIFMAVRLDAIFRVWPLREERIGLTGHWHILSGIIATILLLYYADLAGLKGRARTWFGWVVLIGSDLAFAMVSVFETKRLFVGEAVQQPLVNVLMWLTDAGLAAVLLMLGLLMGWRLVDLFKRRGRWSQELAETRPDIHP